MQPKRKIKTVFLKYSEVLPKTLNCNWEVFSLDSVHPYLWSVIHGIINYLPDGIELPKIDSDFDPHYEDPRKIECEWINQETLSEISLRIRKAVSGKW